MNMRTSTAPTVLFLSHGGGPMPLLGDKDHQEMVGNLKMIAETLLKPSAILVISAHWEEDIPTITSGNTPSLIYDYYGFPEESYRIQYPAPGAPQLAHALYQQLNKDGISAKLDEQRGFDHGLFIPLKIMYPDADIPCIQLSLKNNLNPLEHIKLGESITKLANDDLLIIGSGFSFHNMKAFYSANTHDTKTKNEAFEAWLIDTCSNKSLSEKERTGRLTNWENAPHARFCHPREEHLLPLHVCYGATKQACSQYFELTILNKKASVYLW
ncbi:DODA-type extradiol aromatic ring-opening family dioxygenase [Zooshikella ganghwensis]|uniref:DODA-type extradiol aromatic ring-opening family dioxygenase n=1 Tax=Zooshikella ganghwensis TaxID=202772 RepID=UPI001F23E044|nr:class III extradiol ring-cleavage dioxygenase [Zooshikella ganghwensis]